MLWNWLCPNNDEVKKSLLKLIEATSSKDILGIRQEIPSGGKQPIDIYNEFTDRFNAGQT